MKRIVIVGAGLGGCFVAHGLAADHDVTIIEAGGSAALQARIVDVGAPAVTQPHIASGLGGTTALWHNGLIEIDEEVFRASWPFPKFELAPHYAAVYPLLAGTPRDVVQSSIDTLRQKYAVAGLPSLGLPGLFYPLVRRNVWHSLNLQERVRLVNGEVVAINSDGCGCVQTVTVRTSAGTEVVSGDVFVLAAGGLVTPVLLQGLSQTLPLPALEHAGCHYEDHPFTFVADITLQAPLYRFWNFAVAGGSGNLRMPFIIRQEGLDVSFQIRPAANFHRDTRRDRVRSIVTEIRNNRFNPLGYLRLLTHWDDVLDILSFEFGIKIPTSRYSLLLVAQQAPSASRAVWGATDPATGKPVIYRNWEFSPEYCATLDRAVDAMLEQLGGLVTNVNRFPAWQSSLQSGAHHSGTARLSASPADGVCDTNCRVHGTQNLYVADGSVVPASGMANTGLTIAALGSRLAAHIHCASM